LQTDMPLACGDGGGSPSRRAAVSEGGFDLIYLPRFRRLLAAGTRRWVSAFGARASWLSGKR
jgi:hypothetical protein